MIKIETHCHTRNSSRCASAFPNSLIEEYKEKGYGGAVLTNHLCYNYFSAYEGKTERQKIEFYISLIRQFEKACKENNFKFKRKYFRKCKKYRLCKWWNKNCCTN